VQPRPKTAIAIISVTAKANLADTFTVPSEHKPMKNFGENKAWAYPGTSQIF